MMFSLTVQHKQKINSIADSGGFYLIILWPHNKNYIIPKEDALSLSL